MTKAFLVIEKPDHADPTERRVVTEWMPLAHAVALREMLTQRASRVGAYIEVTVQHEVRRD